MTVEKSVDVPPHGAVGIGVFVEVKEVAVHAVGRPIDVVKGDVFQVFGDVRAAAARRHLNHARPFQTLQSAADDDGIDLHARRDKFRSHLLRRFERINDQQRMHRHRKSRCDFQCRVPLFFGHSARLSLYYSKAAL